MIAGVPTDSGTILDVEQHVGNYLVGIGKAELVEETCKAPAVEPETSEETKVENDFKEMTKSQLETYGRSIGVELNRRHSKSDLIVELEEAISIMEES